MNIAFKSITIVIPYHTLRLDHFYSQRKVLVAQFDVSINISLFEIIEAIQCEKELFVDRVFIRSDRY